MTSTVRPGPRGSVLRWWVSVVVGLIVTLPLAWLLSYAAQLPFFLGLFFFVLFGLIIGAVMHRVAARNRPYSLGALLFGTVFVGGFGWGLSILSEARDLPHDMAMQAGRSTRTLGGKSIGEFQADVEAAVRSHMRDQYPPGGTLGYLQWIVRDGEISRGTVAGVERTLKPTQRRYVWLVRVVLSVGLFIVAIASQTMLLRFRKDPAVRAIDREADDGSD